LIEKSSEMVTHGWVMAKPNRGSRQREEAKRGGRERRLRERETEMVTKTKMATGGGWISLPLAVGVEHGHPQAA
jgi:hypothetical protein